MDDYKKGLAILFIVIGLAFIFGSVAGITGKVIDAENSNIEKTLSSFFGLGFVIAGLVMFMSGRSLKDKIDEKVGINTRETQGSKNLRDYFRRKGIRVDSDIRNQLKEIERKYSPFPKGEKVITLYHAHGYSKKAIGKGSKFIKPKNLSGGGLFMHNDPNKAMEECTELSPAQVDIKRISMPESIYKLLDIKNNKYSNNVKDINGNPVKMYMLPNKKIKLANFLAEDGYIKVK